MNSNSRKIEIGRFAKAATTAGFLIWLHYNVLNGGLYKTIAISEFEDQDNEMGIALDKYCVENRVNFTLWRLRDKPEAISLSADNMELVPGSGTAFATYGRTLMIVTREENPKGAHWTWHLCFVGFRVESTISKFFRTLPGLDINHSKIRIHSARESAWSHTLSGFKALASILTKPAEVLRPVLEVFRDQNKKELTRQGFLFAGPSGSGKSTLWKAMAGYLQYPVYCYNISDVSLNDNTVRILTSRLPRRCIIVLDDIKFPRNPEAKLSEPAILELLSGTCSDDHIGRIIVLATYDASEIPNDWKRPGRLDEHITFGYVSKEEAKRLFFQRYSDETLSASFANHLLGQVTIAELDSYFSSHPDPNDAVNYANLIKAV